MLHGRTIRSTIPRGRVRSIRLDFETAGFTIVDYRDVPGKNIVDLIAQDQAPWSWATGREALARDVAAYFPSRFEDGRPAHSEDLEPG